MDKEVSLEAANKSGVKADPPSIREHHVRVPDQVASIMGADHAHRRGITGRGVRVAVIDSGFFPHPYYTSRGYAIRFITTRNEPRPYVDRYGHGTAQLASLLALAPGAEVLAIKCMERDPSAAIEKAISLRPRILSCAWGFNIDGPDAAAGGLPAEFARMHGLLKKAVELGITVVAAAGNGQYSFPGNMPEVISVGGVFYSPEGELLSSDVSSKYVSKVFADRAVPDVCGLVGRRPHGRLLLVPVPPKATLAKRAGFNLRPEDQGDADYSASSTVAPTSHSGWALFSGTSASTSMVSGAVALLLQIRPDLKPAEIKRLLVESSRATSDDGCRVLTVDAALERMLGGAAQ